MTINSTQNITNCILYDNEVDKNIAIVLSWSKEDCIVKNVKDHIPWEGFDLLVVGGEDKEKLKKMKTSENCTYMVGENRFDTLDLVLKHLGK